MMGTHQPQSELFSCRLNLKQRVRWGPRLLPSVWFILILVLESGCGPSTSNSPPPTKLASRIADADRLIAKYYYLAGTAKEKGEEFEIRGATMKRVVGAVTSGEKLSMGVGIDPIWGLRFYKGTNLLAEIAIQGKIFEYEGQQYRDGSTSPTVLDKLQAELNARAKPTANQ